MVCERTSSRGRSTSTIGFFVDKAAAYASSTIKEVSSVFAKVGN